MEFIDLHPKLVHFPIALFSLGSILHIFRLFRNNELTLKVELIVLSTGLILSVFALLTGNMAATHFNEHGAHLAAKHGLNSINELMELHESFATYTIFNYSALLAGVFYIFVGNRKKSEIKNIGFIRLILVILSVAGLYFIYQTGVYGGELVYKHGVGTEFFRNMLLPK